MRGPTGVSVVVFHQRPGAKSCTVGLKSIRPWSVGFQLPCPRSPFASGNSCVSDDHDYDDDEHDHYDHDD